MAYGDDAFDQSRFQAGLEFAANDIPLTDANNGRPGLGFAILHQGLDCDYIVMSWWDRENELPTRTYTRTHGAWQPAGANESFRVWDIQIIWFERSTFVRAVLCPSGASRRANLEAHYAAC
ncbi:MAG: hypothetical protein ACE5OQ_15340 [Woeseia sp.]